MRYLVVANQTLQGQRLARAIAQRAAAGESHFHVVVPATHSHSEFTWTEGEARSRARERLDAALGWFKNNGWNATGEVGDQQPMLAIRDALLAESYDEIILSTLPAGASRWLHQDLPNRARRTYGLPVTHIEAEEISHRVA